MQRYCVAESAQVLARQCTSVRCMDSSTVGCKLRSVASICHTHRFVLQDLTYQLCWCMSTCGPGHRPVCCMLFSWLASALHLCCSCVGKLRQKLSENGKPRVRDGGCVVGHAEAKALARAHMELPASTFIQYQNRVRKVSKGKLKTHKGAPQRAISCKESLTFRFRLQSTVSEVQQCRAPVDR